VQNLNEKIDQRYRVRLILDNLPVTTYDLEENPESVRPGYEVGYEKDGKRYVNNHLMFKILVHQTNGQYTRAKENMAEIEAAAIVEVRALACFFCHIRCPVTFHVRQQAYAEQTAMSQRAVDMISSAVYDVLVLAGWSTQNAQAAERQIHR